MSRGFSRGKARRGTELPWTKLDEAKVATIRRQHAKKERLKRKLDQLYSAKAFARRYDVAKTTIEKVLARETWTHVP